MLNNTFSQQGAFGPEATAAMGEAAAREELRFASQPEVIRELIARVVIAAANRGELDQIRLRKVALAGFAIFRPRAAYPLPLLPNAALQYSLRLTRVNRITSCK